jgi:hypothetical protein
VDFVCIILVILPEKKTPCAGMGFLATVTGQTDPGFSRYVFNLSEPGHPSPDGRWTMPGGTEGNYCSSCSVSFEVDAFSGMTSFFNSQANSVTVRDGPARVACL